MGYGITIIFISYLAGVIAAAESGSFFFALAAVLVIPVAFIKYRLGRKRGTAVVVYALAFLCAFFYTTAKLSSENTALYPYADTSYITVAGRICEIPDKYDDNYRYTVKLSAMEYAGETTRLNDTIYITSSEEIEYGSTIRASGFVSLIKEEQNSGGYNAALYAKFKNITCKMYAQEISVLDYTPKSFSLYGFANDIRYSVFKHLKNNHTEPAFGILTTIIIGDKTYLDDGTKELFQSSGTMRALHPAFMFIALILAFAALFKKRIGVNARTAFLTAALLLFAVINCDKPVFIKAAVLNVVIMLMKRRYGTWSITEVMSITMLAVGIVNPLLYYHPGIIMSAAASWFGMRFTRELPVGTHQTRNYFLRLAVVFTVALAPIIAYYFDGIALYSALAMIVLMPVVICVHILFAAQYVLSFIPIISEVLVSSLDACSWFIVLAAWVCDKLPFAHIYLARPDIYFLIGWYAAAFAAFNLRRTERQTFVTLALTAALCFGITAGRSVYRVNKLEISFVNVGQGDGALIKAPAGERIIIDGGGGAAYSTYNIGDNVFVPYLKNHNAAHIDTAIVSHFDKDHCEGIVSAINSLKVDKVYMPDVADGGEWETAVISAAEENGVEIYRISSDITLEYKRGFEIRIIAPDEEFLSGDDSNNTSLTAVLCYNDFRALFTGDAEEDAERRLVESGKIEDVDIMKAGHHGSRTSNSEELLFTALPEYVVISVGENNTFSHPAPEVVARFEDLGTRVLRTDVNGDVMFSVSANGEYRMKKLYDEE